MCKRLYVFVQCFCDNFDVNVLGVDFCKDCFFEDFDEVCEDFDVLDEDCEDFDVFDAFDVCLDLVVIAVFLDVSLTAFGISIIGCLKSDLASRLYLVH